jgi:hypothetical protein
MRVLAVAQTANADDVALLATKYANLYDMLLTEGLVAWALTEDIPAYAVEPVCMMLAALSAKDFGIPEGEYGLMQAEGGLSLERPSLAERTLRRQLAKNYIYTPVQADYF